MKSQLLKDLTPAQEAAVTHLNGPCLVVAGAGTGKTTVITRRIAYLIEEHKVEPDRIIALTFTDKAATEMAERVDQLLPYGTTGTTILTFHSFCAELVKRHAFLLGLDPASHLFTVADEISFLRQHLDELPTALFKPSKNPIEFLRSFIQYTSKLKDEYIFPESFLKYAEEQLKEATSEEAIEEATKMLELANLYFATQQLYRDNSVLTYGDLLLYSLQALEHHASVRQAERERFNYLLVDEFQDTNYVQSEIARWLVGEPANIMVVGDDDQAIYSFRGANLANIMQFTRTYPNTRVITLTDNYRSGQKILDTAYSLIQHNNPERLEVQENISKRLISHSDKDYPVEMLRFSRGIFEYQRIARLIQQFTRSGEYKAEDIAILVRSKTHLQGIEATLKHCEIPSQFIGDGKFYQNPSIQSALAFMRFLVSPHTDLNLFYLLTNPPFTLNPGDLRRFTQEAHYLTISLWDYLTELPTEKILLPLKEVLSYLSDCLSKGDSDTPSTRLLHFLQSSGWYDSLKNNGQEEIAELLATLYQELLAYENRHLGAGIAQYIHYVDHLLATEEEVPLQQAGEEQKEGVHIMTVHKSKGLEFKVVFVIHMVEGRFPSRNYSDPLPYPYALAHTQTPSKENFIQEERRLAYVAMTRAKERLYLTSSELYEERKTKAKLSGFLIESFNLSHDPILEEDETLFPQSESVSEKSISKVIGETKLRHSPSSLETYIECPKRYEYEYVLRLESTPSPQINFGISLHTTLYRWFKELKARGSNEQLEELYTQAWIRGGYENRKRELQHFQEGLAALKRYVTEPPIDRELVAFEQEVKALLPSGNIIYGKIDRIDKRGDGKIAIIDYKTGESMLKPREAASNLALGLYALAASQAGYEVAQVELHYLLRNEKLIVPVTSLDFEAIIQQAENTITQIEESLTHNSFPALPEKIKCGYCKFKEICPFRYAKI